MGLGTGATAAIVGGIGAAGSIASSVIGSNAAGNAANQEVNQQDNVLQQTEANQAPYLQAGSSSLGQLMTDLQNGKFGPGSVPAFQAPPSVPAFQAPPSVPAFQAPSLADAQSTPGYQFTQEQGDKGILEGAAASGGNISGGTLKALEGYNTGLADSTYNDVFSRSLSTYNAALTGQNQDFNQLYGTYNAALTGQNQTFNQLYGTYNAALTGQNQAFSQLYAPAQLGEAATQNTNATLANAFTNIGQSQAAGTVGSANAITAGLTNTSNSLTQGLVLNLLNPG